ncbi:MAG: (d)CMP kinase [Candidatus Omnitrophota bacterium]
MIIAIDGPAGAGKSTVACSVAKELGFVYIDTGAIYRAITLKALEQNISFQDEPELIRMAKNTKLDLSNNENGTIKVLLDGDDVTAAIRSPRITHYVSGVAKIKGVRDEMLKLQRSLGRAKDSVLDGRDIGTVVFPDADNKFYLDADFNERVKRRFKELTDVEGQITLKHIESDLSNRDSIDSTRACAPLKKADDAVYIDTTNLTISQVVEKILKEIQGK